MSKLKTAVGGAVLLAGMVWCAYGVGLALRDDVQRVFDAEDALCSARLKLGRIYRVGDPGYSGAYKACMASLRVR